MPTLHATLPNVDAIRQAAHDLEDRAGMISKRILYFPNLLITTAAQSDRSSLREWLLSF
jgi:hypothetical protein